MKIQKKKWMTFAAAALIAKGVLGMTSLAAGRADLNANTGGPGEKASVDDIEAMNTYYKEKQDGRLIHYESSFYNRAYEDTISDVESRMYAKPYEIEEYLDNDPKKPYLLCEFMHDMGNSMGGLGTYMHLIDKYDMYHGGFIWDFIDQALYVKDEVTGKEVLRYGGDFDDRPSDYEFSGDGIVFANRVEKPAMQEVRYYYGLYR